MVDVPGQEGPKIAAVRPRVEQAARISVNITGVALFTDGATVGGICTYRSSHPNHAINHAAHLVHHAARRRAAGGRISTLDGHLMLKIEIYGFTAVSYL